MVKTDSEWAGEIAGRIYEKMKASAVRSADKIPYLTVDGIFDDWSDRISWWTNGFYGGQLWQLYHSCGDELFRASAERIEEKLDGCLRDYRGMDHDSGFKWLLTAGASLRLTGSEQSKNRLLLAASDLAGRFNLAGRFIRAWNDSGDGSRAGWAIIDCMMNLPLLYRASEETNDPRFSQIARAHADTAITAFVREDGSVNHIVRFDPDTGVILGADGGQGMGIGSSWTRGQAWGIYGFALSFIHTGDRKYLETARRIAAYFAAHIPASGLIPVDFCQETTLDWEDSTAAAIAACGLLEIEKAVPEGERPFYRETAMRLLRTLEEHRANWDTGADYILDGGSVAYHNERHNFPIVYGDYFFTEAILKLCSKELFMW